jgi:hypothetical protein
MYFVHKMIVLIYTCKICVCIDTFNLTFCLAELTQCQVVEQVWQLPQDHKSCHCLFTQTDKLDVKYTEIHEHMSQTILE